MIAGPNDAETRPDARQSGLEISNARKATNWDWAKLRMPHRPGSDFRMWPHPAPTAVVMPGFLRAQARRVLE
jgi:hypothetical protein